MKTNLRSFLKLLMVKTFFFAPLLFNGCDTAIPEHDTTPPRVTGNIEGTAFNYHFDSNNDNLTNHEQFQEPRGNYAVNVVASDEGGVASLTVLIRNGHLELLNHYPENSLVAGDPHCNVVMSVNNCRVDLQGDRSHPLTAMSLSGNIIPDAAPNDYVDVEIWATDYGGRSAIANLSGDVHPIFTF